MRQVFMLFITATLFISACNNNKKPGEVTVVSDDGKGKTTVDLSKMQGVAADMQKQTEELQKLPPLTMDQLKALVPEELMSVKRTNFNVTSSTGASMAHAEYVLTDTTRIELSVFDCAGPAGAGIYSMQYMSMMNIQSESDDEYTKTIDYMGGKAYEHCQISSNDCTLTYFTGGRFLVTLEGRKVGADVLKQAGNSLNLK